MKTFAYIAMTIIICSVLAGMGVDRLMDEHSRELTELREDNEEELQKQEKLNELLMATIGEVSGKAAKADKLSVLSSAQTVGIEEVSLSGEALNVLGLRSPQICCVSATGSMRPTMDETSLIVMERIQDVAIGDIVVYKKGEAYIIHRIVAEAGGQWRIEGDVGSFSELINKDAIIGRVTVILY